MIFNDPLDNFANFDVERNKIIKKRKVFFLNHDVAMTCTQAHPKQKYDMFWWKLAEYICKSNLPSKSAQTVIDLKTRVGLPPWKKLGCKKYCGKIGSGLFLLSEREEAAWIIFY